METAGAFILARIRVAGLRNPMAKAEREELFSFSIDKVFSVVEDFESYPDFLSEVKECKVLDKTEEYTDVLMTVHLVKTANYSIRVKKESPTLLWWDLLEGEVFKKNSGRWELESIGSQTQVKYSLDVDFKFFVPGFVARNAVSVNLPSMMKSFNERISSL